MADVMGMRNTSLKRANVLSALKVNRTILNDHNSSVGAA